MSNAAYPIWRWLSRTPVQTFVLCPLAVAAFELMWRGSAELAVPNPWGALLMVWGYTQYHLVGRYRHRRAGGSAGMEVLPERILEDGPYHFTRNPMYLGHLIFLAGLAITLWSWFALIVLAGRAAWFHHRVLRDEERLEKTFGPDYVAYSTRVKRWIPGVF
jgi:protein-S-isoprenylcysteine O-methyltransferase Ste14